MLLSQCKLEVALRTHCYSCCPCPFVPYIQARATDWKVRVRAQCVTLGFLILAQVASEFVKEGFACATCAAVFCQEVVGPFLGYGVLVSEVLASDAARSYDDIAALCYGRTPSALVSELPVADPSPLADVSDGPLFHAPHGSYLVLSTSTVAI